MGLAKPRIVSLICLIIAGEMIFSLPFHLPRYFRPSFLESFDLSNAALGDSFASYGVIAMLSYFPGGLLADRFSARKLIFASLFATAGGGIYLAGFPAPQGIAMLYAYWGLTTILLFWAALLRATREWGGAHTQGIAFGLLDGGRGLAAAVAASIAVYWFSQQVGVDVASLSDEARRDALRDVIYFYVFVTLATACLCWIFIEESQPAHRSDDKSKLASKPPLLNLLFNPLLLMQSGIVIAAYCAYKGLDNYGLFAVDVLGMDEVAAAQLTAMGAYLRPLGAIAAGFFADRFAPSKVITLMFGALLFSYAFNALAAVSTVGINFLIANLVVSYLAVFALRGVYFAVLEEISVSRKHTGTAIGIVSVIGFTPDVFFFAIAGRLLDANPGLVGHQHYFFMLAVIAAIGLGFAGALWWKLQLKRAS